MDYKKLGITELKTSVVGLGTEQLIGETVEYACDLINYSIIKGINLIDINTLDTKVLHGVALALKEQNRKQFILQCDIRNINDNNFKSCKEILDELNTDYIDIGMFNHINNEDDFERVFNSSIIEKIVELKKCGNIKYIGVSSNCCKFSLKAIETGIVDVLTLNIDPKYNKENGRPCGGIKCREMDGKEFYIEKLYNTCERLGIAINIINSIDNEHLFYGEKCDVRKSLISLKHAMNTEIAGSIIMNCKTRDDVDDAIYYAKQR